MRREKLVGMGREELRMELTREIGKMGGRVVEVEDDVVIFDMGGDIRAELIVMEMKKNGKVQGVLESESDGQLIMVSRRQ